MSKLKNEMKERISLTVQKRIKVAITRCVCGFFGFELDFQGLYPVGASIRNQIDI